MVKLSITSYEPRTGAVSVCPTMFYGSISNAIRNASTISDLSSKLKKLFGDIAMHYTTIERATMFVFQVTPFPAADPEDIRTIIVSVYNPSEKNENGE